MRKAEAARLLAELEQVIIEEEEGEMSGALEFPRYRSTKSQKHPYRNRKFLAIDGEGVGKKTHRYVLLGASDGDGARDISGHSLSTYQCLDFLLRMERLHPHHIKVAFSFNYDVAMITRDFTRDQLRRLTQGGTILYCGFRVRAIKGKWLEISRAGEHTKVFDVFSFFGCSFVNACKGFIGDDPLYLEIAETVQDGKDKRGTFTDEDLETLVRPYMHKELTLLVRLMDKLREYLASIEINLQSWHGPGAIASKLLMKHKIKKYEPEEDHPRVHEASRYAYAGGHFECYQVGHYSGEVYSADVNSAYPYALTLVPELDTDFYASDDLRDIPDFALCRVHYYNLDIPRTAINPLPLRSRSGAIFYPNAVDSWVWGCEYNAAKKWFGDAIECSEVIRFNDNGVRPYAFIHELYQQRLEFKDAENPVQLACKLGMNSIYGKKAQRVNHRDGKAPNNHQLRVAGFLTAKCRSMVLDAMMQAPEAIIAVETDGIYSQKPLMLDEGKQLGQWEVGKYDGMMIMQSGIYYTYEPDKETGEPTWSAGKTRGFTPRKTNVDVLLSTVRDLSDVKIEQTTFHGIPGGINSDKLRTWTEEPRQIKWGGAGKRYHSSENCPGCASGDLWHRTVWTPVDPVSYPHHLPWMDK